MIISGNGRWNSWIWCGFRVIWKMGIGKPSPCETWMLLYEEFLMEEMSVTNRRVAPTCLSIPIQWLLVCDYCDYLFCTGHESRPVASSVLLFLTFLLSLSFPAPHRHTSVWIGNPPRGISVRKQRNTVTPMAMLDAQCSGSVHSGGFESSPPANVLSASLGFFQIIWKNPSEAESTVMFPHVRSISALFAWLLQIISGHVHVGMGLFFWTQKLKVLDPQEWTDPTFDHLSMVMTVITRIKFSIASIPYNSDQPPILAVQLLKVLIIPQFET